MQRRCRRVEVQVGAAFAVAHEDRALGDVDRKTVVVEPALSVEEQRVRFFDSPSPSLYCLSSSVSQISFVSQRETLVPP